MQIPHVPGLPVQPINAILKSHYKTKTIKKGITILLLLLAVTCDAQFVFTSLQKKDGLSGNEVFCSYKDSEGFLWFGTTHGLNRFDGSGFGKYDLFEKKMASDAYSSVLSILGDGRNIIWTGTGKGLFTFDKANDVYTPVPILDQKNQVLDNTGIEKMFFDKQQRLWAISQKGLYIVTGKQAVAATVQFPQLGKIKGTIYYPSSIQFDTLRNGVWIGTDKALHFLDLQTGILHYSENNPGRSSIFSLSGIIAIAPGMHADMWISTDQYQLFHYFFSNNTLIKVNSPKSVLFYKIYLDSKNRLWLSNYSGKTFVVSDAEKFNTLPDDSPESYKFCSTIFYDVYEDREKNLWIAGNNGVSKLAANNYIQQILVLPGNSYNPAFAETGINKIQPLPNGKCWICKDDGLYLLDKKTGISTWYRLSALTQKANRVFDIILSEGEWWCATGDGIKILDPSTKKFRPFTHYASGHEIVNRSVSWIHKDASGMIWFAAWGDAVYRYDPSTGKTEQVKEINGNSTGDNISTNSLGCFENTDGKLWISNGTKGIRIYDIKNASFTNPRIPGGFAATHITRDKQGRIWISTTERGLLIATQNGDLLDSVNTGNGLHVNYISELDVDDAGRIWTSSTEGVQYINPETKAVTNITVDMGLPIHDPGGSLACDSNRLLVSVQNKIALIDLTAIEKSQVTAGPMISGISVFEKRIPFSGFNPELKLDYDQNFFVIGFSSLNHNELGSLQYAYKLKGFDKDWVYCGRRQTAAYTNVPDGHYTFLLKCTDASGEWTVKETSFEILIRPPFWKTWWFIGSIVALTAFAGWRAYRFILKRRRKRYIDKTIDYFANSVYGQNSETEICWDIARNCISQLHFEDCVVYLLNPVSNRLVQKAAYGPKNPKGHEIINPLEIEPGKGIVGTVAQTGKPLLIKDTSKDPRYILDDEQRFSELAVPIMHDNKVIGVIDSEHPAKNFFTDDHLKALTLIASISANKIAEATAEALAKENEIKVLEMNKILAESQLMALRAQMNPHFVFNCLNSIQECIVTEKYGEASKYLNKFSKLFRMVLSNSGRKSVTVEEEKDVLELYLELESMRFENGFSYRINMDEELDAEEILIPSMLIQPFVENALWHGLMHREGERILQVSFRRISDELFECVVDDNGIGRKRSFELKAENSKSKRHESKGLAISMDRLKVLQKQGYHAELNIIDKEDVHGDAAGTTVIIQLSTTLVN